MITKILWHKTSDELPEQTVTNAGINSLTGTDILIFTDDECLVIWEGKVKRSRYLKNEDRWEGHLKNQIPEYWVKIKELKVENSN